MTAVAISAAPGLNAPVEITSEPSRTGRVIVARWQEAGGIERELVLEAKLSAAHLEELLNFCYDAGYRDASNPRLFVP